MLKLCANALNEYVDVETPTEVADGFGGYTTTWASKTGLWCKIAEKSGNEALTNGRLDTDKSLEFTTIYRDDILTKDRLVLDGIVYNIRRIDDLDRAHKFLVIYADTGAEA